MKLKKYSFIFLLVLILCVKLNAQQSSTSFYISNEHDYSFVFLTQVLESEETRKLNSSIKKLINDCVINV